MLSRCGLFVVFSDGECPSLDHASVRQCLRLFYLKIKMIIDNPDIPESKFPEEILMRLLCDQSSKRNIIWATDDYAHLGEGFYFNQTIEIPLITGSFEGIIKPRSEKAKDIQNARSKDKAEVFTPSWVCNKQNNLIDEQWFGRPNVFNTETENGWITNYNKIEFSDEPGKTWRDYVKDVRMEITCGEAPYITSRYDTVTGKFIEPLDRIGILDRKFRVVLENYGPGTEYKKWFKWMRIALESTYGYEWQGDNLLLARENVLSSYIRFYTLRFGKQEFPPIKMLQEAIEVITWNFWQMDGLKGVIPCTCVDKEIYDPQTSLFDFGDSTPKLEPCPGCKSGELKDMKLHTGIQCQIKDWDLENDGKKKKVIYFHELLK